MPADLARYTPLLWRSELFLEPHYSWRRIAGTERAKVLARPRWPIRKYLIFNRGEDPGVLEDLARPCLNDSRAVTVVHDFERPQTSEPLVLAGRKLRPCGPESRLLNIATFVVDLSSSGDALWDALGHKSRNMARRAQEAGVAVSLTSRPSAEDLRAFDELYRPTARRAHLSMPLRPVLANMIAQGRLLHAACRDEHGVCAASLVFHAEEYAFYLYGARRPGPPGAGQLLQWEIIRSLKERGLRWYDLGGVPSRNPGDGIYEFKKSLGGAFVDLGGEHRFVAPLIYFPYKWYKKLGSSGRVDASDQPL